MSAESRNMAITPDPNVQGDIEQNTGLAASRGIIDQSDSRDQSSSLPDMNENARPSYKRRAIGTWRRTQMDSLVANHSNDLPEETARKVLETSSLKNKAADPPARNLRKRRKDDLHALSEEDAVTTELVSERAPKKSRKDKASITKENTAIPKSKTAKAARIKKNTLANKKQTKTTTTAANKSPTVAAARKDASNRTQTKAKATQKSSSSSISSSAISTDKETRTISTRKVAATMKQTGTSPSTEKTGTPRKQTKAAATVDSVGDASEKKTKALALKPGSPLRKKMATVQTKKTITTGNRNKTEATKLLSGKHSHTSQTSTLSRATALATSSEESQQPPAMESGTPKADEPVLAASGEEDNPVRRTDLEKTDAAVDIPTHNKPEAVNAGEFSDEDEEEAENEADVIISEPSQSVDMLESLMGIEILDDFTRGALAINEATRMNLEMQQQVKDQLRWIDERIKATQGMMRQVHSLASKEIAAGDKPSKIYQEYPDKIEYFVDDDGEYFTFGENDDFTDIGSIMKRSWSVAERRRLFGAIHAEAQRAFVLDIMSKGEEHRIWEIDKLEKRELEMISVDRLDWKRISTLYVKTRTPTQCIIQWTTQEHPTINKKPWTNAESKRLMQLVNEYSIYGNWEVIARDHKSNRTASQCFSHYQALQNLKISKKKWTTEEDEALKEAVSLLGERNWQHVAAMFAQRTGNQCLQRWTKSINPAIRRGKWKKEEDEILRRAVQVYGAGNWTRIQKYLPGRTDMQVRERYMNVLDPSLNLNPSTEEEEDRLWELVEKHGRKWSMLTQFFPGRTDNRLLRMYKTAEKRRHSKRNGEPEQQNGNEGRDVVSDYINSK